MTRQIKFRAWDNHHHKMIYEGKDEIWNGDKLLTSGDLLNWFEDSDLMQFTGLLDKNGKEIYEGDIVKRGRIIREVKWCETGTGVGFNIRSKVNYGIARPVEIIGNIYENPELLK